MRAIKFKEANKNLLKPDSMTDEEFMVLADCVKRNK